MKKIVDSLMVLSGLILVAFSVSVIVVPNKIIQGGVTGFSTILVYTSGIPVALSNFFINILLIISGIKFLGKSFVVKTLVSVVILTVFIEIFSFVPPITEDIVLATILSGFCYGIGIGLTLLKGASSGGTDILGRILQHFFPHISIGKLLMLIDGIVILGGYIVFKDMDLVLYGVVSLFISTFAIDYLIRKLNVSKIAFVISEKGDEIAKKLVTTTGRGVTKIDVIGSYTNTKKHMLVCAIKEREMPEFQRKIEKIDREAFTIFSESQQIFGNGFYVYK